MEVSVIEEYPSPVPGFVDEWNAGQRRLFVQQSQDIATHLDGVQTGKNPGGLLAVILGRIDGRRATILMKFEREDGAALDQKVVDGKHTFDLSLLQNLVLTRKTQVFKVALFPSGGVGKVGVNAIVCDNQTGYGHQSVAEFFLKTFLGCDLAKNPNKQTKEFYDATRRFIHETIADESLQAKYFSDLVSYLGSEKKRASPGDFAGMFMRANHRQRYISFLGELGIPNREFQKDVGLIRNKLKRVKISYEQDVELLGSPESFKDHIKIDREASGLTKTEIILPIKKVDS